MFLALFSPRYFGHRLAPSVLFVTLKNLTYKWTWVNTCLDKYILILLRVTLALINGPFKGLTIQQSSAFFPQSNFLHVTEFGDGI